MEPMFTTETLDRIEFAIVTLLDETRSYRDCTRREQRVVDLANALLAQVAVLRRMEAGEAMPPDHDESAVAELLHGLAAYAESGALKSALKRGDQNNLPNLVNILGLANQAASLEEQALRKADAAGFLLGSAGTDAHLSEKEKTDKLLREKGVRK